MSFSSYDKYKVSGLEWPALLPAHWKFSRLKFCASIIAGQSPPSDMVTDGVAGLPFLQGNAEFGPLNPTPRQSCDSAPKRASIGDILLSVRAPVGAINTADQAYGIGRGLCAIRPLSERIQSRLVFYLLTTSRSYLDSVSTGSTYDAVSTEQVGQIVAILPPFEEQLEMVAFLDNETAKIDALVQEQARLIELLKEKRQAVISQAVTKGLDPNVPMKDSAVEWLGGIPAHWSVTRLKYAASHVLDCPHETPVYSLDGSFAVIRTADIAHGVLDLSDAYKLDEAEYRRRIRREPLLFNDIVYGREGERWGHAALVPEAPLCCLGQRMMQFRAGSEFSPVYLMWFLNSDVVYRQGEVDTVGATSPHVNVETIRNYVIAQPPLHEQLEIATYLSDKCLTFEKASSEANLAITLLLERRSALISAAVTGKIDVRGLAPQPEPIAA